MSSDTRSVWELIDAAYLAVNRCLIRDLHAAGYTDLRAAHGAVFEQMGAGATTVSAMAEGAQMTKQAMGELVEYLEASGYLVRVPDERDRRAKRVELTERGRVAAAVAWQGLATLSAKLDRHIGVSGTDQFRRALLTVLEIADA